MAGSRDAARCWKDAVMDSGTLISATVIVFLILFCLALMARPIK